MMTTITREQAQALSELVHQLRPEWDAQGVLAALAKARDRGPADVVCIAAIRAAATPTNRTPAVIALSGDHWASITEPSSTGAVPGPNDPRCTVPGHEHYRVPCKGCRSEALGLDGPADSPIAALDPGQAERNARGARAVRAALNADHTTTEEKP